MFDPSPAGILTAGNSSPLTDGAAAVVPRPLHKTGLTLGDIDLIEIPEAFGGRVASNLAAWKHGWKEDPIGKVDRDKLNQ